MIYEQIIKRVKVDNPDYRDINGRNKDWYVNWQEVGGNPNAHIIIKQTEKKLEKTEKRSIPHIHILVKLWQVEREEQEKREKQKRKDVK